MFKEAKELATTKMPAEASNIIQAQLNKFSHDGDWISCLEVAKTEVKRDTRNYLQVTEPRAVSQVCHLSSDRTIGSK